MSLRTLTVLLGTLAVIAPWHVHAQSAVDMFIKIGDLKDENMYAKVPGHPSDAKHCRELGGRPVNFRDTNYCELKKIAPAKR
jgi:hypothetical protein